MLNNKKLQTIVRASLGDAAPPCPEMMKEAYIAQVKQFHSVSSVISEKARAAHLKLYQNYVTRLNEVSARLDGGGKMEANSSNSEWRSLKSDEAYLLNAVWFHELFFANAFDTASEIFMDTLAYIHLQRDWGTFEAWQADFYATALASREGWVVCGYNMYLKRFVNTFVDGHSTGVQAGLIPLIVVDVWSHSYCIDFGAEVGKYVATMMQQLNWEIIEERITKITKINEAMR